MANYNNIFQRLHYTAPSARNNYKTEIWIDSDYFGFHLCTFNSVKQLKAFAKAVGGFTWKKHIDIYGRKDNTWELSHKFINNVFYFWKKEDLPPEAKPIKLLSNGLIVDGYYTNDGETIAFYRPNPNAKEIYKPLSVKDHIAFQREYGVY